MKYLNALFNIWHILLIKVQKHLFIVFHVLFVSTQIFSGLMNVYINCTLHVRALKYTFRCQCVCFCTQRLFRHVLRISRCSEM